MRWSKAAGIAVLALFAVTAEAQQTTTTVRYDRDDRWVSFDRGMDRDWCQFKGNELNLSVFGTGTVGEDSHFRHGYPRHIERDGRFGAGLGVQYFPVRYLGFEGYAYTENTDHNFVDNVGGNLILRFPIKDWGVAPYIFGGGGRQFDPIYQWSWDAGAGIEWRFLRHMGVFVDAQYVWAQRSDNYGLGRAGFRFGF